MIANSANLIPPQGEPVLRDCVETLSRVANYHLPSALDRRLLWLSENKERLDDSQRQELTALVDLADDRALDKVQAKAILEQLVTLYPELVSE
jgi:hypothetical protein